MKRRKPKPVHHSAPASKIRYSSAEMLELGDICGKQYLPPDSWFRALKRHAPLMPRKDEINALAAFEIMGLSGQAIMQWLDSNDLVNASLVNRDLLLALAKQQHPEFFNTILTIPSGYLPWNELVDIHLLRLSRRIRTVQNQSGANEDNITDDVAKADFRSYLMHSVLAENDFQTFVVEEDLIEMLEHTDFSPPTDEDSLGGLDIPFAGMTFLFPQVPIFESDHPLMAVSLSIASAPGDDSGLFRDALTDRATWSHFYAEFHNTSDTSLIGRAEFRDGRLRPVQGGDGMAGDILDLVTKVIMAMNAEPEVIESMGEPYLEKVHPLDKRPSRKRRPKTLTAKKWYSKAIRDGEGTGRTIPTHWRRGHFRRQAYGKGLAFRKRKWIMPIRVKNKCSVHDD